jgi:hypothetical protein
MSQYVTLETLKKTLGITGTSGDDDGRASLIAASGAVDLICQRGRNAFNVDATTSSRTYSPRNPDRLAIDDLASTSGLLVTTRDDGVDIDTNDGKANVWTLNTDFVLEPENATAGVGAVEKWPYERIVVQTSGAFRFNTFYRRSAKISGQFGWAAVPAGVLEATELLAERLFKMKREAPLGVIAFEQLAVRVARADANVMILLAPYMRHIHAVA